MNEVELRMYGYLNTNDISEEIDAIVGRKLTRSYQSKKSTVLGVDFSIVDYVYLKKDTKNLYIRYFYQESRHDTIENQNTLSNIIEIFKKHGYVMLANIDVMTYTANLQESKRILNYFNTDFDLIELVCKYKNEKRVYVYYDFESKQEIEVFLGECAHE